MATRGKIIATNYFDSKEEAQLWAKLHTTGSGGKISKTRFGWRVDIYA